ncbi:hypothetical protein [Yoonia sp.]|uniref:hypothetical protein n=1 Tax=Yoonia sp. TaxID=2212373 RepID=UPI003F6B1AF6
MKSIRLAGAVVAVALCTPAIAAHNNPWATETDAVLAKNHDENQAQSIDTPGTDEMRGNVVQNVNDKAGSGTGGGAGSGAPSRGQGEG